MDDYCNPDKRYVTHLDPIDTLKESDFHNSRKGKRKLQN